jgi:predicted Zn-dependent protease with MMP-like domain
MRISRRAIVEQEQDLDAIDRIYQALDDDEPELALRIALDQISRVGDEDPVLQFFAGKAWVENGEADRGIPFLQRSVELDPDDLEFRGELGFALLEAGRTDEASELALYLIQKAADYPDGHYLDGMILEARGSLSDADRRYGEASSLDPERYPTIRRLDGQRFEQLVEQAAGGLPEAFREHLDQVATTVEPVVPDVLVQEGTPALDTLGLFTGTPLERKGRGAAVVDHPPRILLFQRNLERFAALAGDLQEQITVTLYHELGHYLGMDEDDLDDAGFR